MSNALVRFTRKLELFLSKRLSPLSRLMLLLSCLFLVLTFLFPLWHINLVAPQYRGGLDMWIYSYQLVGGNEGQDIAEINLLNHYIGMEEIHEADFWEMQMIPFALGFFILFGLRAAVFGQMRNVIDHVVLFLYFAAFSMGAFVYRLYRYGHELDPAAPMNVDPFWPPLIGTKQLANMTTTSLPGMGSLMILLALISMVLALWFSRKQPSIYAGTQASPQ